MPFEFVIDVPGNVIREKWSGTITLEELYDSCRQELAHPDFSKGMHLLSDFREAQSEFNHEELMEFAQYMAQTLPTLRHAVIVSRRVGFGVARMFGSMIEASSASPSPHRVFFDADEAEQWLIPPRTR